jgi:hypothetical protein
MTKKLLIAGGFLAVILVVSVVKYLHSNLDSIVKNAIEKVGTEMTGVSVDVDDVTLALAEGRGEIGGLVIDNPRGYKGPHAVKLGSVVLAIDPATASKDVVVIRELTVEGPDIVYDKGPNGTNVEAIQANIDEYSKTHAAGEAPAKEDGAAAKRLIVESLQIRNGKIRLPGRDRVIDLPPLSMRDIGKSRGGMTGSEIASIVVKQMTQATVSSVARGATQDAVHEAVGEKVGEKKEDLRRRRR